MIPEFKTGPVEIRNVFNELIRICNRFEKIGGDQFINVSQTAHGTSITLNTILLQSKMPSFFSKASSAFLAKITVADGDARYTIVELEITSSDTSVLTFGNLSGGRSGSATNLDELIAGSSDLPANGTIFVLVNIFKDAGGVERYVFSGPAIVVD